MIYRGSFKLSKTEHLVPVKSNKCKLFVLIIRKAGIRVLKESLSQINSFANSQNKAIKLMSTCCDKNVQAWKIISWQQMKIYGRNKLAEKRIMKNLCTLSKRLQIMAKKNTFDRIQIFSLKVNSQLCKKIISSRNFFLYRLLRKILLNIKRNFFMKIKQQAKDHHKRNNMLILNIIWKNLVKRRYLESWSKLLGSFESQAASVEDKMNDLLIQFQDMKIQIQNKNESIERLHSEARKLKNSQPGNKSRAQGDSLRDENSKLKINKKQSQGSDHYSNEGSIVRQDSFGSLLNGSLFSHKSRLGTQQNIKCGCQAKYNKSKNTNATLKKQLQLIKTELAFTKEINEQMQFEMKQYMIPKQPQKKIDQLESQLSILEKDKQILREKILKCDKYVVKMKMQFKMKVQEIYRRVRRDG